MVGECSVGPSASLVLFAYAYVHCVAESVEFACAVVATVDGDEWTCVSTAARSSVVYS